MILNVRDYLSKYGERLGYLAVVLNDIDHFLRPQP
jgi:hypothetical protein